MIEIFIHWLRVGGGLILALFLANFSQGRVHEYALPSFFLDTQEKNVRTWEEEQSPKIIKLFAEHVYGTLPHEKPDSTVEHLEEGEAFGGAATRIQKKLTLSRNNKQVQVQLLMYIPKGIAPHKTLLAFNLEGNQTVHADISIIPSTVYSKRLAGREKAFSENQRGARSERWPIEELIERGYAVVTAYYGDVEPDFVGGHAQGVHALYPEIETRSWGSISAWAWGLSRVADYLESDTTFDATRLSLFGFSRLGKAALWAAANDTRFSAVVVDSPGEGGASLARRNFGETIQLITYRFPHWFNSTYTTYAGKENTLPVDQHMLLALLAPRPVLVSSADKDSWSDPIGEEEAVHAAKEVYALYGSESMQHVLHHGTHAVTKDEWEDYLDFLDSVD